jgi:anti-sigma regulatory factor (Ser/Thr protein kinase)
MDMTTPICVAAQHLRTLRVSLPAHPASAAIARRRVKAVIRAWDLDIDAYVGALLTSELVTNALRHGLRENETIQLVITSADNWMRVYVYDSSRSEPVPLHAPLDAEAGRGLTLLDHLSGNWGFQQTAAGKAVYFTLEADEETPTTDVARDDLWWPPRLWR